MGGFDFLLIECAGVYTGTFIEKIRILIFVCQLPLGELCDILACSSSHICKYSGSGWGKKNLLPCFFQYGSNATVRESLRPTYVWHTGIYWDWRQLETSVMLLCMFAVHQRNVSLMSSDFIRITSWLRASSGVTAWR